MVAIIAVLADGFNFSDIKNMTFFTFLIPNRASICVLFAYTYQRVIHSYRESQRDVVVYLS
jgi:hypothetical protein